MPTNSPAIGLLTLSKRLACVGPHHLDARFEHRDADKEDVDQCDDQHGAGVGRPCSVGAVGPAMTSPGQRRERSTSSPRLRVHRLFTWCQTVHRTGHERSGVRRNVRQ